jgi:hypothetical protein
MAEVTNHHKRHGNGAEPIKASPSLEMSGFR